MSGIKRLMVGIAMLATLALTLSSCNRGIGCPSDFSIKQSVVPVVTDIIGLPLTR